MYEVLMLVQDAQYCILRTDDHHYAQYVCKLLNDERNSQRESKAYWVEAT